MTRILIPAFLIMALGSIANAAAATDLVLAENGQSAYKIVVADDASPSTKHGAKELRMFLRQMTGAELPIVSDRQTQEPKEIILGDNVHLRKLGLNIDFAPLGDEGYLIRTVGESLIIAGGKLRGNMYGVYGLLEDHFGCRWFAPGVSRIPTYNRLTVGAIDNCHIPILEYRESFTFECFDADWCARNRLNSCHSHLDDKRGGRIMMASLCHTFSKLVPPEKYFKEHPEYYSLVKGRRVGEYGQLCCTNPDVVRICTEAVRDLMRKHWRNVLFSVSQNDWDNFCECPKCQALADEEGSQMGPVLQLVNHVAEGVEEEFPDKIVQTLAYRWTRKPPKHLRPRPNVVIMLCSIECCFSHPLETCDSGQNRAFRADMEGWSKISSRIWIWDYVTNFHHYLMPFPNQQVRGPNIRYYVAHNVKGIFEQDAYDTADSELWALGAYLSAKLLWNPSYDTNKAMDEFLDGYYGEAALPIREYLDMVHGYVKFNDIHVGIYDDCDSPHLADELLAEANRQWQQAEDLVAEYPEVLDRVKRSRLSVDYAILERARFQARKSQPANEASFRLAVSRFQPFFDVLESSPLSRLREHTPLDKAAYRRNLANDLKIKSEK